MLRVMVWLIRETIDFDRVIYRLLIRVDEKPNKNEGYTKTTSPQNKPLRSRNCSVGAKTYPLTGGAFYSIIPGNTTRKAPFAIYE